MSRGPPGACAWLLVAGAVHVIHLGKNAFMHTSIRMCPVGKATTIGLCDVGRATLPCCKGTCEVMVESAWKV